MNPEEKVEYELMKTNKDKQRGANKKTDNKQTFSKIYKAKMSSTQVRLNKAGRVTKTA